MSSKFLPNLPHYFPADCFGGSSDLVGTGSTLFSGGLFWRQLRFGGNWFHIIFRWIIQEAAQIWREPQQKNQHNHTTLPAQIWRELAPHYFLADCFGGSSDMVETTTKKMTTVLYTKYENNTKNPSRNLIDEEICQGTQLIIFIFQNMKYGDTQEHWIVLEAAQYTTHNTHRHNNHQDKPYRLTHNFHFSFLVKCEQIDVS